MPIHWLNLRCTSACLFAALAAGDAQEQPPAQQVREVRISARPYVPAPNPLRVETDLVEVGVVVRNHDGRAISGLKRENFAVKDEGASRELTYFAVETPGVGGGNSQKPDSGGAASPAPGVHIR
jgi:hypothetical protein